MDVAYVHREDGAGEATVEAPGADDVFVSDGSAGQDLWAARLHAPGQVSRPGYSISALHARVETKAHLLLNEYCVNIVTEGRGHDSPSGFPSWLPDWTLSDMGEQLGRFLSRQQRNELLQDEKSTLSQWANENTTGILGNHVITTPISKLYIARPRIIAVEGSHVGIVEGERDNIHQPRHTSMMRCQLR